MSTTQFIKRAADVTDVGFDWEAVLTAIDADEIIAASVWEVVYGDLAVNLTTSEADGLPGNSFEDRATSVWCKEGPLGSTSVLMNTITTNSGRSYADLIEVRVADVLDITLTGRYTSYVLLEQMFGRDNIRQWADIDNDQLPTPNTRLAAMLAEAEDYIDTCLAGSVAIPPFTGAIPPVIVHIATTLAGVKIYEARGVKDFNAVTGDPQHRLSVQKRGAERMLSKVRSGIIRVGTPRVTIPNAST